MHIPRIVQLQVWLREEGIGVYTMAQTSRDGYISIQIIFYIYGETLLYLEYPYCAYMYKSILDIACIVQGILRGEWGSWSCSYNESAYFIILYYSEGCIKLHKQSHIISFQKEIFLSFHMLIISPDVHADRQS